MAIQTTTFKGARYLVKFHDPIEWASTESYEAIEAVQHEAFTYISKQPVPAGVQIDNADFWLLWADPNAQMEQLQQLVEQYAGNVDSLSDTVSGLSTDLGLVNDALPISEFSAQDTVKDYIDSKLVTVDTFADLAATTSEYVQVLQNDSEYGLGDSCIYKVISGATSGGHVRNDGSVVHAIPNQGSFSPNAPMGDICNCASTWMNRPDIVYGREHTPFDDTPINEMDCISFSACLMYGITYENSALVTQIRGDNTFGNYRSALMPSVRNEYIPFFTQVGDYFAEQKRLFAIDKTENPIVDCGIAPGDLLLVNNDSYDEPEPGRDTIYYKLSHCAIVLQLFPESGEMLVAQAGGMPEIVSPYSGYYRNHSASSIKPTKINFNVGVENNAFQVYARPDYSNHINIANDVTGGVYANYNMEIGINARRQIASINFAEPIKRGQIYTLVISGESIPSYVEDNVYFDVELGGERFAPAYRVDTDKKSLSLLIFPIAPTAATNVLNVYAINASASQSYVMQELQYAVYKGYAVDASTNKVPTITLTNNRVSFVGDTPKLIIKDGCLQGFIRMTFADGNAFSNEKIGELNMKLSASGSINVLAVGSDFSQSFIKITNDEVFLNKPSTSSGVVVWCHINVQVAQVNDI